MNKLILLFLCCSLVAGTSNAQGKGNKNGHGNGHNSGHNNGHNNGPGRRTTTVVTHTRVKHNNGHHVKMKPSRPRYTRPASPGRDYVYVEEDWTWSPASNTWVWYGNRWVPIARPQAVWVPGRWVNVSYGWTWRGGSWR